MSNAQQVPATLFEFQQRFPTDRECEAYLFAWRWPEGFRCPRCGGSEATKLSFRRQYQCRACKHQASVTAGTVMQDTKLSLRVWFWGMFLVARHKKSISALQFQRDLGLGSYRSAWLMLQKIRRCFGEKAEFPLTGLVEVDETLVGAQGKGAKPGKDPGNKAIVVAGVALGRMTARGFSKWRDVRVRHVPDYKAASLAGFVRDVVAKGSKLATDGWRAYDQLSKDGYRLVREVSSQMTKDQMRRKNPMPHVHLFFSNLKTWLSGRFHGVSSKYLRWYLDEFVYRLNRRCAPPEIFGWLARRMMRQIPCTLAMVKGADSST